MASKKKVGKYVLYSALTALVLFMFLMYTAKPIVGDGRTSCTAIEYISTTADRCPSLCLEEKPRILSSGFCDWTYTCVDASKCANLPSPISPAPTGPPNFKVTILKSSNSELTEKTTITYSIQVENIGGPGVMSVESGVYKASDVRSWGYDLTTYAAVGPEIKPLCGSGETNVQRKGITFTAGESQTQTVNYEITVPKYENADYVLIAGSFNECGEKYQHFDAIPVKIIKSTGGTGGTTGTTTTLEWPKITFFSDIGKWWNDRASLEKAALGAFILLIVIWYMFFSAFGTHSEAMKRLKVQELTAKAGLK